MSLNKPEIVITYCTQCQWLLRAGVLPEHIDTCDLCTACHPNLFWSHRKMGNQRGLQTAAIVLP